MEGEGGGEGGREERREKERGRRAERKIVQGLGKIALNPVSIQLLLEHIQINSQTLRRP